MPRKKVKATENMSHVILCFQTLCCSTHVYVAKVLFSVKSRVEMQVWQEQEDANICARSRICKHTAFQMYWNDLGHRIPKGARHQEPAWAAASQVRQGVQRRPGPQRAARHDVQGTKSSPPWSTLRLDVIILSKISMKCSNREPFCI